MSDSDPSISVPSGEPPGAQVGAKGSVSASTGRSPSTANETAADARRTLPSFRDLLRPSYLLHWIFGLAECWIFSRNYQRLLTGLPFLAAVVASILLYWWMRHSPDDQLIARYEAAFEEAARDGDLKNQEAYLNALLHLRPRDEEYQFRLGRLLIDNGRPEGLTRILELAPDQTHGYAPARLWLIQQARDDAPVLPLTDDQIETQLLMVLRQHPDHAEAHRLLADLYVRRSEWNLAEHHLEQVTRFSPDFYLDLAKLKVRLQRTPEDIEKAARSAADRLTVRLAENRSAVPIRIALAEAWLLLDQKQQARELLVAGLQQQDDPQLRKALSDLDLLVADERLAVSFLNRDICRDMIVGALQTSPSNPLAVQKLVRIHSMGSEVTREQVRPAIEYWTSQLEAEPNAHSARLMLGQLFQIAGAPAEAADTLRPVLPQQPELRFTYARLLTQSGRDADARQLVDELIRETSVQLESTPGDTSLIANHVEMLLLASRALEARQLLRQQGEGQPHLIPLAPQLQSLYGRTCLTIYDQLIPPTADLNSPDDPVRQVAVDQVLELLSDAIAVQYTALPAIDRLARLAFSGHPASGPAEEMTRQLRVAGDSGAHVLNLMGMHALHARDYQKAASYLEQANSQTRGTNPMILNNLAVSLIRGPMKDLNRALDLAEQTLKLIPDHPDALSTRGEVFAAMGRWTEAAADLRLALQSQPKNREIHQLLEQVYLGLNEPDMAREHRQQAERLGGS